MASEDLALSPPGQDAGPLDGAAQLALYRLMIENVADMITRGDRNLKRSYVSPASREMLGFEPAEMVGGVGYDLVHPDDRGRVRATIRQLGPANPQLDLDFRMQRKDGAWIWVEARYRHIPEDGGVLAVLRDITARKVAEERLAEAYDKLADANVTLQALVNRDGLTGLANRRCFDMQFAEEFHRAVRHNQPLALLLIDVDSFKAFNDRYGHLPGDDCLRRVCAAIRAVLRRPGDLAARYGGEEIAVLLPATDEAGAVRVAERMRGAIAGLAIEHRGSLLGVVSISVGVSALIAPTTADRPDDLIVAADQALYQAKLAGRNQVRALAPTRAG
jgi:diguanylate cyclase (GGDEF)-like protein/PAS domain S-box-containing protein